MLAFENQNIEFKQEYIWSMSMRTELNLFLLEVLYLVWS